MKKIMFNDRYGLTKAVLGGWKTRTSRIIHQKYFHCYKDMERLGTPCLTLEAWLIERAAPFKVGEVVAVAQSYGAILAELEDPRNFSCMEHWESKSGDRGKYAELAMYSPGGGNKMFVCADEMPHQIRFTNVWVERLQDISEEDCMKEGIMEFAPCCECGSELYAFDGADNFWYTPCEAFSALIDKVSGKGTWESNPWVFVYEFELVK